jgi:hypothetical protein
MRSVLAVAVSFVTMSVVVLALSIAPWFVLGLDVVLEPGRFVTIRVYDVYALLVSVSGAVLGGWMCALIGRSRMAVAALAALCFAGGVTNAFAQRRKPEPGARVSNVAVVEAVSRRKEPAWFTLVVPVVGFAGVLIGGRRAGGHIAQPWSARF